MRVDLYDRDTVAGMKNDWLDDGLWVPRILSVEDANDVLWWLETNPTQAQKSLQVLIDTQWEKELKARREDAAADYVESRRAA